MLMTLAAKYTEWSPLSGATPSALSIPALFSLSLNRWHVQLATVAAGGPYFISFSYFQPQKRTNEKELDIKEKEK